MLLENAHSMSHFCTSEGNSTETSLVLLPPCSIRIRHIFY